MSHTLHRVGTEENLKHDFVFLCMPSKDINHEGSAPKLRRFFQLCEKNHCVTMATAVAATSGIKRKNIICRTIWKAVST